jgi:O-antigen/teichoic acid export membrane protein
MYNLMGSVLPLGLSLFTVPAYLALIGPERFGVLAIAWLLLGYFGLFDLGLTRATTYTIASQRDGTVEERATTFWSALAANAILGVSGGFALYFASDWFFANLFKVTAEYRVEILAGMPILALSVPVATMAGVMAGALQGREKFLQTNSISVTSTALFQLFPLGLAWVFGPYLPMLLAAAIAARSVALILLYVQCHKELVRGVPLRVRLGAIKQLLRYGGWVLLTSLFGPLLFIVDRFAIGAILGAVAVTIYSVPFQLAQRISSFPAAITNALFPKVAAKGEADTQALGRKAITTIAAIISVPVLCGILIIGPFLDLWVGKEIGAQSTPVGRLMLLGFWANAFALVPFMRLQASGRPDLVTKSMLAQIPPYFVGLYFGMIHFGLIGCAAMFVMRSAVDFLILSWLADRNVRSGLLVLGPLILLLAAIALGALVPIAGLWWCLGALALLGTMSGLAWFTIPLDVRTQCLGWLSGFREKLST